MTARWRLPMFAAVVLSWAASNHAAAQSMDEDTITVVEEDETPGDLIQRIELPEATPNAAHAGEAPGQGVAEQAKDKNREHGREFGQQVSEEARNKETRERAREETRSNVRAGARGEDAPGRSGKN